jgi:Bacterial extracellular solute-binding protein
MSSDGPRTTFLGKLVILAFIGACGWGAYRLLLMRGGQSPFSAAPPLELRIGCGEGKRGWLTSAATAFGKTAAGRNTKIDLLPEDAEGLTVIELSRSMDKSVEAYAPFLPGEKSIALTPMVFVVWSSRLAVFRSKYGDPSLEAFAHALAEPRGWEAAGHPEWGFFRFGIEDRDTALALFAYDAQQKTTGLTPGDVLDIAAKSSFQSLARNATPLSMRDFATRGPDAYDAALVYESSALELLEDAQKRWGEVRIVYPQRNLWSDNPYYIVDAPWSTKEQREAAQAFLAFLLTETSQKDAIAHGFRPSDPHVPTNAAGSPFVAYQRNGVRENVGQVCTPPPPAVMSNLLAAWQRAR